MDKESAVKIAAASMRAAAQDFSVYNRQSADRAMQAAKAAGATETEVRNVAYPGLGSLPDHS